MRAVGRGPGQVRPASTMDVVDALGRARRRPRAAPARRLHGRLPARGRQDQPRPADLPARATSTTTDARRPAADRLLLRGLALPDETRPEREDLDERLSMCVLYLAAWLTQRGDVPRRRQRPQGHLHRRGLGALDLQHRPPVHRPRRPATAASTTPGCSWPARTRPTCSGSTWPTSCSAAFIGRLTDEDAQRDALRFLPGIRDGHGLRGHLRHPVPAHPRRAARAA